MKFYFLILLLFANFICNAQYYSKSSKHDTWGELDTLYNKDFTPIAILGSKVNSDNPTKKNFTVLSVDLQELISVRYSQEVFNRTTVQGVITRHGASTTTTICHWDFYFFNSENRLRITKTGNTVYFSKKNLLKILDEYKMMKDGTIDPEGEKKFILDNGGQYVEPVKLISQPVILDGQIFLESELIGKFYENEPNEQSDAPLSIVIYEISLGEKIAEAFLSAEEQDLWSINTFPDNKTHSLLYDPEDGKEKLFMWLIKNGYLK